MGRTQEKIKEHLQRIAATKQVVYGGTVKTVDEKDAVVEVLPDEEDDEFILPVMLRSSVGDLKGIVMIPKVGSEITFVEDEGLFIIVNASELDKVMIDVPELQLTCDNVVINKGGNHGLAKVLELTKKLNTIESDLNKLKTGLSTVLNTPAVNEPGNGSPSALHALMKTTISEWATSQLTPTQQKDIENTKIKH